MKWKDLRSSSNVEDRRGGRVVRSAGVGIGSVVVALIGVLFFQQDPLQAIGQVLGSAQQSQVQTGNGIDDTSRQFISKITGDLEDTWDQTFNGKYQPTKVVMFTGAVNTACGNATADTGPFYCPADQQVYIDTSFFNELNRMTNGKLSDFAAAYVIAHEVGHHVQNLTGVSDKVRAQQARSNKTVGNQLSVRLELQADCYAGVWGHSAQSRFPDIFESGDIEGAVAAAQAIGDDTLQRGSMGGVNPDSFTHGSSAQRIEWFTRGFKSGNPNSCNTFQ